MKSNILLAGAAVLGLIATPAFASTVIYDGSAPASGPLFQSSWSNSTNGQNFLMEFTLSQTMQVDGVSIWASTYWSQMPQGVTVRLRSDLGGTPSTSNIAEINLSGLTSSTPNADGTSVDTAMFAPITVAAGTYWIGLSGNFDLSQATYGSGYAESIGLYQLSGETLQDPAYINQAPFLVYGGAVPEPTAWAMFLVGFGAMGFMMRGSRRKAAVVTA